MHIIQELLFVIAFGLAVYLFSRKAAQIRRNILLGRDVDLNDQPALRWRNLLLLAFGQKKMFRKPLVAVLHFFVYAGFVIINLEILEIILDGILGTHRLFAPILGGLYPILIGAFEVLAVLVIVGCAVFLARRNIVKVKRLDQHELDGWPRSDANYILITEIVLMLLFLTMNTADHGSFLISGQFKPLFSGLSADTLVAIERTCWWLHIIGILAFLNYLPYSKHLHIILAFPNAYYADLRPKGKMENMPAVQKEVSLMLQPELAAAEPPSDTLPKFGAKDVQTLPGKTCWMLTVVRNVAVVRQPVPPISPVRNFRRVRS